MEEERIDLGAVILPIDDNDLITELISSGKVMLVVSKNHRLGCEDEVNLEDLRNEKFITFNEKFMMYNKTIEACKIAGFEPDIILKTSQWDYIKKYLSLISQSK